MTPYNPDDWLDLLGLLIAAMAIVGAAGIPSWITTKRQRALSSDMAQVKDQVKNGHPTNLRDDLDSIKRAVAEVREHQWELSRDVSGVRTDIGQLRGELRDERTARIDADDQLNQHIKTHRAPE